MFVITGMVADKRSYYMSWDDVAAAARSGHWDVQLHAHLGHARIAVGPADRLGVVPQGPAYAWRKWSADGSAAGGTLESFESWGARVSGDLDTGMSLLRAHVPWFEPLLFAVPFGDYAESASNDPRISPALRKTFDQRFYGWFTQESVDPAFTPAAPHAELHRFVVDATVTTSMLFAWLGRH
jgi:hypothetical protein